MTDTFCTACGNARSGAAPFCGRCGSPFSAPESMGHDAPVPAAVVAYPPVSVNAAGGGIDDLTTQRSVLQTASVVPPAWVPPTSFAPAVASAPAAAPLPSPVAGPPPTVQRGRALWAHLVLWPGVGLMLLVAYLWHWTYLSNDPIELALFPATVVGSSSDVAAWNAATLVLLVAAIALLPPDPRSQWATLTRASGYVLAAVGFFAIFSSSATSEPWTYVVYEAPLGLIALAWLEARGRRRLWFLGAVPVMVLDAVISRQLPVINSEVLALLSYSAIPLVLVVILGSLAATTGTRWQRSAPTVASGDPMAAPQPWAGGPTPYTGQGGTSPQNTLAVVAFVLSFFFSIPGIVCGHVALSQIKRTGERGRGLAIAGLVIGYVGVAALVLYILVIASVVSHA